MSSYISLDVNICCRAKKVIFIFQLKHHFFTASQDAVVICDSQYYAELEVKNTRDYLQTTGAAVATSGRLHDA